MITVKDLIKALKTYNPDLQVALLHNAGSDNQTLSPINQIAPAAMASKVEGVDDMLVVIFDETTRKSAQPVMEDDSKKVEPVEAI